MSTVSTQSTPLPRAEITPAGKSPCEVGRELRDQALPAHPSRAAAAGSAMRLAAVTHSAAMGGRHAAWVGASSVLPSPPDPGRRETHAHRKPVPADPSPAAAAGPAMRLAACGRGSRGAVGAARHLGRDETECPPLPPTGADGTPAQLARAHRTVLAAALIRPRPQSRSGPAHARHSGV